MTLPLFWACSTLENDSHGISDGALSLTLFQATKELHLVQYTFAAVAILQGSSIQGRLVPRTGLAYFFVLEGFDFEVVFDSGKEPD